ncbi:hypothetical protein [Saccharothrix syringae]|uniref:DUF5666 domain-containing protein n=1 Tax=Saccharothrix syringae TaxID=103733 RepID=A0A5Q0GVG4_SACSY|nr:hypothetical protein [Saccharothrix syringae]QFZ17998.1 hypothetical protein EKG83_11345 [Saccharothrix syringae]
MSTEPENPTWGDQPPPQAAPGSGWNGRRTLVAVAIAVGIAAAGGGVIYAASNSEAAQQGMGGPRGYMMRGGPGMVLMGGPFGDSQHGEFQNGEVTEVSDSSITVKSGDGYTQTYKIDGDTKVNGGKGDLDDIKTGDPVTVVSTESTADSIMAVGDVMRGGGDGRQQGGRPPADGQGTPPTR